ncbi:MAG TPA: hypothetical protein VGB77_05165, partial [Abditibacteriaceae bacterium]
GDIRRLYELLFIWFLPRDLFMTFHFSEQHIEEFYTRGVTVFRSILPTSLISDLRRVTDQGRDLARRQQGPQAQRFQPVAAYDIEQQPFIDYRDLPVLRQAVAQVLSPQHNYGDLQLLGVLLEPADLPWCTAWHRDILDNLPGFDPAHWGTMLHDLSIVNQVNCALYEDSCTWIVPGSHWRPDLPREKERFPQRPVPGPDLEGRSYQEREQLCREYCQSMPGAVCLHLGPGDFALYRPLAWHLGNYVPHYKRATLHDIVQTPEGAEWRKRLLEESARRARGTC